MATYDIMRKKYIFFYLLFCYDRIVFAHPLVGGGRFAHQLVGGGRFAHQLVGGGRFAHQLVGGDRFAHQLVGGGQCKTNAKTNVSEKYNEKFY